MNRIHNISDHELDRMIRDYFDCNLTATEEFRLALYLASLPDEDLTELQREALAVMCASHIAAKRQNKPHARRSSERNRKPYLLRFAGVAAAICTLFAIAAIIHTRSFKDSVQEIVIADSSVSSKSTSLPDNECYAYVDGSLVTDADIISDLVKNQLLDLEAAKTMADQCFFDKIEDLAYAIDKYNSSNSPGI